MLVRASPIMESLTGIMIAGLIFYSGKLILREELDINNFFSFLAAMMLAYQPVRSLATLNMGLNQGIQSAKRVLPIIDFENKIKEKENPIDLNLTKGEINFENVEVHNFDEYIIKRLPKEKIYINPKSHFSHDAYRELYSYIKNII